MRIEEKVTLDAARGEVWESLADPTLYPRFISNIRQMEARGRAPAADQAEGSEDTPDEDDEEGIEEQSDAAVGSRYALRMHVGSADIGGTIEIVELHQGRDIAWTSITGIDQRGRWRLRDNGDGGTDVMLRLSYDSPGGMLGAVADQLASRQVRSNLRQGLARLKADIDGESADVGGETAVSDQTKGIVGRVAHELGSVRILTGAGVVRPVRPDKLVKLGAALVRWGRSPAAGFITGAIRSPDEPALIDELGTLTFAQVDKRTNALAHGLSDAGIKEGDSVAIMCRNSRYFVEATVANAKLGAHSLYLNTSFAGPQITEVVKREKPVAIVFDEEFTDLLEDAATRRKRFVGWTDSGSVDDPTLEELIEASPDEQPVPPEEVAKMIILTSGTTGTPKGANRGSPDSLDPAVSFLSKIPLQYRATSHIACPLFHSWGFAHFSLGLLLGTTMVLTRTFDPEESLRLIERNRAEALVVVPVMMSRMLELPAEVKQRYDTSSLKVVAASGSALPGDLATKWMDEFGDNLFNLYGSTEVAWATIATPADMRTAPGTAGKPPRGTILKLFDERGMEVPTGETGRIFVANSMMFDGYTGGGSKDEIDGLMSTCDLGRFDDAGRLFVEGRDDEMIVSGGENLFPKEVEDTIARHASVSEVACIGVEDEKFGQRLRAFVVLDNNKKGSEDTLKSHVKSNLANYKVPREIWFLDELPRNATGKVLKRELKEIEKEPK
ncbi:MAG: AMP-binding protein [Thermoleophilaceae bacterium]